MSYRNPFSFTKKGRKITTVRTIKVNVFKVSGY